VAALHAEAAARVPGVTLAAVCDVRPEAARALAAATGARAFPTHGEMFAAGGLDGVVVTAPHSLHAPIAADAAAAGLHVLMEKPMATTLEDCLSMIELCDRAGVRLAVGNIQRYLPAVREAVRVLRSGRLGQPRLVNHRRTVRYEPGSRPGWFFDPVLAGGGILMNIGGHCVDRAQQLAGAPVTEVRARTWRRAGFEVETDALAELGTGNGVRVVVAATSTGLPPQDETEVVAEDGALRISEDHGTWLFQGGRSELLVPAAGMADIAAAFGDQLADFAADRPPVVDGAYGASVVAAVLAAYESAASGRTVPLPAAGVRVPR
jgi:predicted dehydrogenase